MPKNEVLVPTDGPAALALAHALGARFSATSLRIDDPDIPFEHWRDIGRAIGFVGSTWHWWLGDWFNIGEELYGDDASGVVDDLASRYEVARRVTGNATGTLQNIRSICKRVPDEVRREELSIWTHSEVAKLELKDQKKWLDRAVKKRWRRQDLRVALRGGDPDQPVFDDGPGGDDERIGGDPANAGVSVEDRIKLAARHILTAAQPNGDGTYTVPGEPIDQLRAAFGQE